MYSQDAIKGSFKLRDALDKIKYDLAFSKTHPDYFHPDGCIVFTGSQGSGKSLSAVRYIDNLCRMYPKALVVSNCSLNLPNYHNDYLSYEGILKLSLLNNGEQGIICFIDEIQAEFSNLESKKVSPSVISVISQQRKRRLHVVGTSQILKRIAKPWREQLSCVVDCSSFLNLLQINSIVDFTSISEDSNGNLSSYKYRGREFFFRCPRLYEMYDTSERISIVGGC